MMSEIILDYNFLKGNPFLNIRVPIDMSSFFMISLNREICAIEITRLGLNKGEAEIDDD